MLNQKFFNGIGNYLRAEILFRCNIAPFEQARKVLEPLNENVKSEDPDILELCNLIPKEVLTLGGGKGVSQFFSEASATNELRNI